MAASPSTAAPQSMPTSAPRRFPLIAVLGLHVAADVAIAHFSEVNVDDYFVALMLGVLFAQVALAAVWTVWAPVPFPWRLGTGLLAVAWVVLTLALAIWRSSGSNDIAAVVYGVIFFVQWTLSQIPLWMARVASGHRLTGSKEVGSGSTLHDFRFGVGQLLALTGCVAVLLGLARVIYSSRMTGEFQEDWRIFLAIVALLAGFSALAPLPEIWACFAPRPIAWLAAAAVCASAATIGEMYLMEAALGDPMEIDFFAVMNASMFLVIAATLLTVRFCGYRLRRGNAWRDDGDYTARDE
jgi:hypothetical protein